MNLSKFWDIVKDRGACSLQSMGLQRVRDNLVTEQQQQSLLNLVRSPNLFDEEILLERNTN